MILDEFSLTQLKKQLNDKLSRYKGLADKITHMTNKLTYNSMQRINQVALVAVHIKHTDEFVLKLGMEYWAEVKSKDAIDFVHRKINNCKMQLEKVNSMGQQKTKVQAKEGIRIDDSKVGQRSILQKIGTIDGEDIFNIVEIEENEQTPQTNQNKLKLMTNPKSQLPTIKQKAVNIECDEDKQQLQEESAVNILKSKDHIDKLQNQLEPIDMSEDQDSEDSFAEIAVHVDDVDDEDSADIKESYLSKKIKEKIKAEGEKGSQQTQSKAAPFEEISQKQTNNTTAAAVPPKLSKFKLQKLKEKQDKQTK